MKHRIKAKKINLLIYPLIVLIVLQLQWIGLFDYLELEVSDLVYQTQGSVSQDIFVIGIDEETLQEYGAWDVWGREKTAELINLLCENEETAPAVIAVDVGFHGDKDLETDQALVDAVEKAGNVVLNSTATFGSSNISAGEGGFYTEMEIKVYEEPYPSLNEVAYRVGYVNIILDKDGVVRRAPGASFYKDEEVSTFDVEVYRAYLELTGQESPEAQKNIERASEGFYINYTGLPRQYFGTGITGSSFCKVLSGEYPVRAFKDAIVYIGAYSSGMQDNYYTSIEKQTQMYGVEVHANILDQIMNGIFKQEIHRNAQLGITALIGLVTVGVIYLLSLRFMVPLFILLVSVYGYGSKLIYDELGYILPLVPPLLMVCILLLFCLCIRYFTAHRERVKMIDNYSKYLSKELAVQIAEIGEKELKLGGMKKDIAVLFVDIRGFTSLSEQLSPERVVEMLNSYLKVTSTAIFEHKGAVDKFIGDATMGIFNAPLDLEDYVYHAVCAGMDMVKNAESQMTELEEDLKGKVGFGIGIHCGDAVIGNIGTAFRMEYTAIGDTVNTAARLESIAKAGQVIISEAVYEQVKDRILCEDLGKVRLKGKATEARVYQAIKRKTES